MLELIITALGLVGVVLCLRWVRSAEHKLVKALRQNAASQERHAEAEVKLRQTYERYVIELRALWGGISDAMEADDEQVDALCARFAVVLESIARVAEEES